MNTKKLLLTVGLAGLLLGSARHTHTVEPVTMAVGVGAAAVLGVAALSKVADKCGYQNVLGVAGALIGTGIAGYLLNSACASVAIKNLLPWAHANAEVVTLVGSLVAGTGLAVKLTEGDNEWKRWAKWLFWSGAGLSVVAAALYMANANGKRIVVGIEDIKPIKKGWFK
jgi:hypothetical protein